MHAPIKYVEKGCGRHRRLDGLQQPEQDQPETVVSGLSDKPLLKSYQKTAAARLAAKRTRSPDACARRARRTDGKKDVSIPVESRRPSSSGTANLMVKDCSTATSRTMAMDRFFTSRMLPGRDIRAHNDEKLHNHGSSTVKHGCVGADRRPHEPLQHDVRSVLHGRQPGRFRPRADVG